MTPGEPDLRIRIVAALVNPRGNDQGAETVTLLNVTDTDQSLTGWSIANRNKAKAPMPASSRPGGRSRSICRWTCRCRTTAGLITLLDASGLKVHGVAYTKAQVARQGWTITF